MEPNHAKRHRYQNSYLDVHHYQVFGRKDKRRQPPEHIEHALGLRHQLSKLNKHWPVIVGEWSGLCTTAQLKELAAAGKASLVRHSYVAAQLLAFQQSRGWFFWTYRTEKMMRLELSCRRKNGWLPKSYE